MTHSGSTVSRRGLLGAAAFAGLAAGTMTRIRSAYAQGDSGTLRVLCDSAKRPALQAAAPRLQKSRPNLTSS